MHTRSWVAAALTCILCLCSTSPALAQPPDALAGIWTGELEVPGAASLRLAVTIGTGLDGSTVAFLNVIDQNSGEIPCDKVIVSETDIFIGITAGGIEIEGSLDDENQTLTAEFRQSGATFPLILTRSEFVPSLKRPQTPEKPYPYTEEEVTYENADAGVILAGTLTYPTTGGPFPAVILLTGSGQQNRDEELLGHKPFLVIADHLTRHGIAVLRTDDRGIGGSTGDFSISTTADFADDALAGIEYLKTRPVIDHDRIGLIGHSEGGMIAPIAASISPDVSFIVLMAAPGTAFVDIILFQQEGQFRLAGMSEENIALQLSWYKRVYAVTSTVLDTDAAEAEIRNLHRALSGEEKNRLNWPDSRLDAQLSELLNPWWRYVMAYDAAAVLKEVSCPVLAISGEKDTQVPARENLAAIEQALLSGGNQSIEIIELPGLNHLFQTAETGSAYEYGRIEETVSPAALNIMSGWISDVSR